MQLEAAEPGRRPAQQFAGVDLRRPKGYAPPASQAASPAPAVTAGEGEPCPRCESRDTKFCYYNNYNTAQPRHFCKGCCCYWTKGGTLRNVPVSGGTRKKPSSSSSASSSSPSSTNSAAKPKRPYKKKRCVAPPEPATTPVAAADSAKTTTETTTTTTTTPTTDAASEITTELVVPAAAEEDSLAHLLQPDGAAAAVALGLGLSDFPTTGKGGLVELEPDSFEWPAAFDLGACWASAGFADPDPALFLNFP